MAPKQPAESAGEEPEAKKSKVEKEETKVFEEPDAPKDNRPLVKETIAFTAEDATLNVVPTMGGRMLSSLTEGGMSYLVAGARANVGQKAGRYMFEVRVVCSVLSSHVGNLRPKPMLRIGFSTSSSSLVVGDDAGGICFDGDGSLISERKRDVNGCQKYGKEHVLAVVLNLDAKSPNFNTMALYRDGVLISVAVPLPEALKGQPLFPHIAFRNVSVSANFGPQALCDLPFKCRMLQGAASSDVVAKPPIQSKDGKYELVLPVSFPDEGTFDWLDSFLEKNPQYTELSDRKIIDWARASGLWTKVGYLSSNDKPSFNFGIPAMDDLSVRRIVNAVAPVVPRNYVIMEVKSNLVSAERKEILKRFNYPCYKKVAHVVVGEPSADFKQYVQGKILKEKKSASEAEWKAKKEAKAREKEVQAKRRKIEEQNAAKMETKGETEVKDEAKEETEATEIKEEKDVDIKQEDEKVDIKIEEADSDAEPPAVELTDEEKTKKFFEKKIPDLGDKVLNSSFSKFSAPEEEEGFDDIRYEWAKEDEAKDYMKTWVFDRKRTTRVDDIRPGQAFRDSFAEFEKLFPGWQDKQKAFASAASKKGAKKEEEDDEVEISSVTDVMDVGEGTPLFERFEREDWALTRLRYEFYTLLTAFAKDVDDPDRVGISLDHFPFYYGRYFNKTMDPKTFGKKDLTEVVAMIKDVVTVKDGMFVCQLAGDAPGCGHFVKLAETNRRERQRRIDAGDESARIKFPDPASLKKAEPKVVEADPSKGAAAAEKGGKKGVKGGYFTGIGGRVVGQAYVPMASAVPKAEPIATIMEPVDLRRPEVKGDGKGDAFKSDSGKGPIGGCFNCGGPHKARDCFMPDGKGGRKGKDDKSKGSLMSDPLMPPPRTVGPESSIFGKASLTIPPKGKDKGSFSFDKPHTERDFSASFGTFKAAPSFPDSGKGFGSEAKDIGKGKGDKAFGKACGKDLGKDFDNDYGKGCGKDFGNDYGKGCGKDLGKDFDNDYGKGCGKDIGDMGSGENFDFLQATPKVVAPKHKVVPPKFGKAPMQASPFDGQVEQPENSWNQGSAPPENSWNQGSAPPENSWNQGSGDSWDSSADAPPSQPPPVAEDPWGPDRSSSLPSEDNASWGKDDSSSSYSSDKNTSWKKDDSSSSWNRDDSWGSKRDRNSWDSRSDRKPWDSSDSKNSWDSQDRSKSWETNDNRNSWDSKDKGASWESRDNTRSWESQDKNKSWQSQDSSNSYGNADNSNSSYGNAGNSWSSPDNNPWEP